MSTCIVSDTQTAVVISAQLQESRLLELEQDLAPMASTVYYDCYTTSCDPCDDAWPGMATASVLKLALLRWPVLDKGLLLRLLSTRSYSDAIELLVLTGHLALLPGLNDCS